MPRIVDIYPLSPIQQGILFHSLFNPDSGVYVVQTHCILDPSPDVSAFERAWNDVVRRHSIFRTAFEWQELEDALQVVHDQAEISLTQLDWRDKSKPEQHEQLQGYLAAERIRKFDFSVPPLMRLALIRLDDQSSQFIWTVHHLLIDTWSETLLFAEASASYRAFCQGRPVNSDTAPSYRDYICWIQQQDPGESDAFWRGLLQGFRSPTPLGGRRASFLQCTGGPTYQSRQITLSTRNTNALQLFARQHELTLNTLTQGAWALLLGRYSGEDDIVFGVTVSGRPFSLPGAEFIIGPFLNTLPMRVRLQPNVRVSAWLRDVQARSADLREFEYSPLVQIQKLSDVQNGLPLFESIYVFQSAPINLLRRERESANGGLAIRDLQTLQSSNYPLCILVTPARQFSLEIIYDLSAFDPLDIGRMLEHLRNLLEGMIAQPGGSLLDLPLLTEQEQKQLLVDWNSGRNEYPREFSIGELLEAEAERDPGAIALRFGEEELSYGELNCRANQLARYLQQRGVGLEDRVGVMLNRSMNLVVSLLAVLKAGGAYVALDPEHPQERLGWIIEDAGVKLVVTESGFGERARAGRARPVLLDAEWGEIKQQDEGNPGCSLDGNNLAYLIYTSGSTGRPKGIATPHRGVVRLVKNTNYVELGREEVFLLLAPVSFDASTFEIWGSLLNGATLVIMAPGPFTLEELSKALKRYGVTTLWLTAGVFHQMVSERAEDLAGLKQLLAGGDVLSPLHVESFLAKAGECRLINGYGPTENTTFSCTYCMSGPASFAGSVPIGRPIGNSSAYVLDGEMRLVPRGVWGELYTGGDGLARCYFNQPELTAINFVPDPFSTEAGARLYRTGDRARHLPDGNIEFGGRRDQQVKVRGFRIEPKEIESVLCQHEAVADCVVMVREDVAGDQRLVAYVVAHDEGVSADALRNHLGEKLPQYMVPSTFVLLPELPLSPNGKVDRRALANTKLQDVWEPEGFVPPRSQTEMILSAIWAELLRTDNVGKNANFFELGGHSLLAMRLASKLRESFKVDLPLRTIFAAPTLERLAHAVDAALRQDGTRDVFPIRRRSLDESAPLSFAERRLWLIQHLEPESTAYNVSNAIRLRGHLNVGALKAALNEIVRRHEILRTTFAVSSNQPIRIVTSSASLNVELEDLSVLSIEEQGAEARRVAMQEGQVVFNLENGPLFRVRLLRLANEYVLTVCRHHIIFDAWSHEVFTSELAALYDAFDKGQASPLPELPIQYSDFACWERDWLDDEKMNALSHYWKAQLEGAPAVLNLPVDRPVSAAWSHESKWQSFTLDKNQTKAIRALSQSECVTVYMVLVAIFKAFLYRYTGQSDFLIGTPVTGRNQAETESLIGCFLNMLVLRTDLSGNPTFRKLLGRVRDTVLGAYTHQEMPFERLIEELKIGRAHSSTPLVQIVFSHIKPLQATPKFTSLEVTPLNVEADSAKVDWLMLMIEQGEEIIGSLQYRVDLFSEETISRAMSHLANVFQSVLKDPNSPLDDLEMLSHDEQLALNRKIDVRALSRSFSF